MLHVVLLQAQRVKLLAEIDEICQQARVLNHDITLGDRVHCHGACHTDMGAPEA